MQADSIHFETIDLIRKITSDGKLEITEVWELADHLNDNRLARKRWPGTHLWPIIQQVFEDNVVTGDEMRMLGEEIANIEETCSEITDGINKDRPDFDINEINVSPLEAPMVEKTIYAQIRGEGEKMYASNLRNQTCTCQDWENVHEVIPEPGIGRLCKHLIDGYREVHEDPKVNISDWPDAVANLIFILHRFKVPADPLMNWQFLEWKDPHQAFVGYGNADWATVFADTGESRFERFGFHLQERRWSYGATPPDASTLAGYFQYQLDPFSSPSCDVG